MNIFQEIDNNNLDDKTTNLNKKKRKREKKGKDNKNDKIVKAPKKQIKSKELNPKKIKIKGYITDNSYSISYSDGIFLAFKSVDNIYYLVYTTKDISIVTYNLEDNCIMSTISNAHDEQISNFSHYQDEANYRDLVLSISSKNKYIKLWDINQLYCLCSIKNIYNDGYLNSACFINDGGNIFFLTCHFRYKSTPDLIKVYNCSGYLVRQINNSNFNTVFIDTFYDKKLGKNYIVAGSYKCVISYDYDDNLQYNVYTDYKFYDDSNKKDVFPYHDSIIVDDRDDIIKLIESSGIGRIRIWEFHTSKLIKVINIAKYGAYGLCLWDNNFLFAGSTKTIKLIDINNENIIKQFSGHTNEIITIKKIEIPKYGNCLISQDRDEGAIILWTTD